MGEGGEEQGRPWLGKLVPGIDYPAMDGDVVRVAVGAVGAERDDDVGGTTANERLEPGGLRWGVPEEAVGEAPAIGFVCAYVFTGAPKFRFTCPGNGVRVGGATVVAFPAFTGACAVDCDLPSGSGRNRDGPGDRVGLVIRMRHDGKKHWHGASVRALPREAGARHGSYFAPHLARFELLSARH